MLKVPKVLTTAAANSQGRPPIKNNAITNESKTMTNAASKLVNNKAALNFCMNEALEKVASEIRGKKGSGTTAKAVEVLMITNENIKLRVLEYASAAMVGVALAVAE